MHSNMRGRLGMQQDGPEGGSAVNGDVIVTLCGIVSLQPYQPYILVYVHNATVTAQTRQSPCIYVSSVQTGESLRAV